MPRKVFTPEQIVAVLRQIEVAIAQGKSTPMACREAGISDVSYYRRRKECGGLQLDQAKRMKDLEKENSRLKKIVADLSLKKAMLKEVASGNFYVLSDANRPWPCSSKVSGYQSESRGESVEIGAAVRADSAQ